MSIQSKEFTEFIKLLDNSGSLPYVVLVGLGLNIFIKKLDC